MKKVLGLLVFAFILSSCDDGDIVVESLNFDDVAIGKCSTKNILYKINGNEIMQLTFPANTFTNEVGRKDDVQITSEDQVRYRQYNSDVTSASICNDIQPAMPTISEEWIAQAGQITVNTTLVNKAADPETGRIVIDHYDHQIVFKNIKFSKPSGTQTQETLNFGTYTTPATTLPFNFAASDLKRCAATNRLYSAKSQGTEGLYLSNYDAALFSTATADLDTPKTFSIGATQNSLVYRLFTTALPANGNDAYFCTETIPATPTVNQLWTAESGTIQVVTTSMGGGVFKHTIRLKAVTFRKDANTAIYYGDDILYGELTF